MNNLFKFTFAIAHEDTHEKCMELSLSANSYEEAMAKVPLHPKFEVQLISVVENV